MLGSKPIVVIGISKRIAKEGNFDKFISFAIQCEGIDELVNVCSRTFSFLIYRKGHRFSSYNFGWYYQGCRACATVVGKRGALNPNAI